MQALRSVVGVLWRLVVVPIKLAVALVGASARVGFRLGRAPLIGSGRVVRSLGVRAVLCGLAGLVLGLLLAPVPGRELRRRVLGAIRRARPSDEELAERVRFELAHAPRTWHLSQPDVSVAAGRARLEGSVADTEARRSLVSTAEAVPGVSAVDDLLTVGDDGVEHGGAGDGAGGGAA